MRGPKPSYPITLTDAEARELQHLAAPAHRLLLVEATACADVGHLLTGNCAWHCYRQRYTDMVGAWYLRRKQRSGRLIAPPALVRTSSVNNSPRALSGDRAAAIQRTNQSRTDVVRVR